MMQKSWFLVGVFMGWDTGFKCVSTEKWCFSYITLHPLGVIHNTTGFILLKPRPTRRTFSGWKRTCRSWEVTYWVWPTSQLAHYDTWLRKHSQYAFTRLSAKMFEIKSTRKLEQVISTGVHSKQHKEKRGNKNPEIPFFCSRPRRSLKILGL